MPNDPLPCGQLQGVFNDLRYNISPRAGRLPEGELPQRDKRGHPGVRPHGLANATFPQGKAMKTASGLPEAGFLL